MIMDGSIVPQSIQQNNFVLLIIFKDIDREKTQKKKGVLLTSHRENADGAGIQPQGDGTAKKDQPQNA